MKKNVTALIALIVTLCAAFAAAQHIPDDPPSASGGATVDTNNDTTVAAKEQQIKELDKKAEEADRTLQTRTDPETRSQAILDACASKQEANGLRQELAALKNRQSTSNERVANFQTATNSKIGRLQASDAKQNGQIKQLDADMKTTNSKIGDFETFKNDLLADDGAVTWITNNKEQLNSTLKHDAAFYKSAKQAGYVDDQGNFDFQKLLNELEASKSAGNGKISALLFWIVTGVLGIGLILVGKRAFK